MQAYLSRSEYIDCDHPIIQEQAQSLKSDWVKDTDIARACFEFVRDHIQHSWDYKSDIITCKASDVLRHRTGYCYAKSHLLAALLRANGIPAGLCYQRLLVDEVGGDYCLHGLNAVYLEDYGWYRVDPRGNKPGVNALFSPPLVQLAFHLVDDQEADIQGIWPEPMPIVVKTLQRYDNWEQVSQHLPGIALF